MWVSAEEGSPSSQSALRVIALLHATRKQQASTSAAYIFNHPVPRNVYQRRRRPLRVNATSHSVCTNLFILRRPGYTYYRRKAVDAGSRGRISCYHATALLMPLPRDWVVLYTSVTTHNLLVASPATSFTHMSNDAVSRNKNHVRY